MAGFQILHQFVQELLTRLFKKSPRRQTMTMTTLPVFLLLCFAVAADSTPLSADFGKLHFAIDVGTGDDYVAVTMHKPLNAPETFRQTTNLHIFSRSLVAMRNCRDGECYVRPIVETEEELKQRVNTKNSLMLGNITLERLTLRSTPLSTQRVKQLFGLRIADFCLGFNVYDIGREDAVELDPEGYSRRARKSSSLRTVDVAGTCCCCCKCCLPPSPTQPPPPPPKPTRVVHIKQLNDI